MHHTLSTRICIFLRIYRLLYNTSFTYISLYPYMYVYHFHMLHSYIPKHILYEHPRTDWKMYLSRDCDFYDSCGKLFRSFRFAYANEQKKCSSFGRRITMEILLLIFYFFIVVIFDSSFTTPFDCRDEREFIACMLKTLMMISKSMHLLLPTAYFRILCLNEAVKKGKKYLFFPHLLISN